MKIREIAQEIADKTGLSVETIMTMPLPELANLMAKHNIKVEKIEREMKK